MRDVTDVRSRLVDRLNRAVRHPGMLGGELTIRLALEDLTYLDQADDAWAQEQRNLVAGGYWTAAGVGGAFALLFGSDAELHKHATASVYAEMAHRLGYLVLDRVVSPAQLQAMRAELTAQPVVDNRVLRVLVEAHGPPSVHCGGRATLWPCTAVYATNSPSDGCIAWDFWNQPDESSGIRGSGVLGPEAILRNVRVPSADFPSSVILSTLGRSLRRENDYPLALLQKAPAPLAST